MFRATTASAAASRPSPDVCDEPSKLVAIEVQTRVFFVANGFPVSAESDRCWNTVTWTNESAIVLCVYSFRDERPGRGDRVGLGVQPVLGKPSDVSNG
jgi:hypothetical protein